MVWDRPKSEVPFHCRVRTRELTIRNAAPSGGQGEGGQVGTTVLDFSLVPRVSLVDQMVKKLPAMQETRA